jgi:NTP pyrophosphatase (non-canonical NTP hydrolase)
MQELGELSDHACKGEDIRDDLGDMLVVMLNIMKRNNFTIEECLEMAYNDIKDRKGRMVDGIFVKEQN